MANKIPKFGSKIKDSSLEPSSETYYKEGFNAGNKVIASEVNRTLYNLSSALTAVLDAINNMSSKKADYNESDLTSLTDLTNKITEDLKDFATTNTETIVTNGIQDIDVNNAAINNLTMKGKVKSNFSPYENDKYDLGNNTKNWQDLYLSGKIYMKENASIQSESSDSSLYLSKTYGSSTYKFGIDDGKLVTKSDGLNIVANNTKITQGNNVNAASEINFEDGGLRIYNASQIDISDDSNLIKNPGGDSVHKIKIGGKQDHIDNTDLSAEKDILLMAKSQYYSEAAPFAVDKSNNVYINGYNMSEKGVFTNKSNTFTSLNSFPGGLKISSGGGITVSSNSTIARYLATSGWYYAYLKTPNGTIRSNDPLIIGVVYLDFDTNNKRTYLPIPYTSSSDYATYYSSGLYRRFAVLINGQTSQAGVTFKVYRTQAVISNDSLLEEYELDTNSSTELHLIPLYFNFDVNY